MPITNMTSSVAKCSRLTDTDALLRQTTCSLGPTQPTFTVEEQIPCPRPANCPTARETYSRAAQGCAIDATEDCDLSPIDARSRLSAD